MPKAFQSLPYLTKITLLIWGLGLMACQAPEVDQEQEDPILASVGGKHLPLSTLEQMLHSHSSREDSLALTTAYVGQWLRDQLMMIEASDKFALDKEVNQLVADYRGRLLMHRLESTIIAERYDTLISDDDIRAYYEEVKPQFLLNESIMRCTYVKFSRDTKSLDQFYKDWKADEHHAVRTFASAYGDEVKLDTFIWHPWSEVKTWYENFSKRVTLQGRPQRQLDRESQYYLKVIEVVDEGAFAPLSYIRPQLEHMLLHRRRRRIVDDYKQELYEKALAKGTIKM